MLHEDIDAIEIIQAAQDFDLIVADLGADYRQKNWELLIERADLAILVTDCDEKALVRVQSFIETMPASKDFCLVVNSREKNSYYTDNQMSRELADTVKCVVKLPHYPDAEKRIPKTLPVNNPFNLEMLSMLFSEITPPEKIEPILAINLPKMPKFIQMPKFTPHQKNKTAESSSRSR